MFRLQNYKKQSQLKINLLQTKALFVAERSSNEMPIILFSEHSQKIKIRNKNDLIKNPCTQKPSLRRYVVHTRCQFFYYPNIHKNIYKKKWSNHSPLHTKALSAAVWSSYEMSNILFSSSSPSLIVIRTELRSLLT